MIKISKGGYKKDWGDTVNITPPRLHVIWPSVLLRFNSRNCTKPSPLRCEHVGWSAKRGIRSTPGALTSYGTVVAPLFRRRPASFVSRTNAFPWDVSAITRRPETGWRYNDTSISYTSDARTPTGELLSRPTTAPPPRGIARFRARPKRTLDRTFGARSKATTELEPKRTTDTSIYRLLKRVGNDGARPFDETSANAKNRKFSMCRRVRCGKSIT